MSIQARRELIGEVAHRYGAASRGQKSRILDELCASTGYGRKYAVRLLGDPPKPKSKPGKRRRARKYGELEIRALRRLWPTSGYLGALRLTAALGPLMEALERHGEWVPEESARTKILEMSPSTCGRLLREIRAREKPVGPSLTRPGTLKRQIAIRRGTDWDDARPGFLEADLVAHCASDPSGEFLYTLTMTDVSTGWTELAAVRNRSWQETLSHIRGVRARLPFPLAGIDSDNGSEFVNWHLAKYCRKERIVFTRGRPYTKNDGCRVEQKNWAVVRKHVGYGRLDTLEHWKTLVEIHNILCPLVNFFEPSVKLIRKDRTRGGAKRVYDAPLTPYQRVLESDEVSQTVKDELRQKYLSLNPAALRRRLQAAKQGLWDDRLVSFFDDSTNPLRCDS